MIEMDSIRSPFFYKQQNNKKDIKIVKNHKNRRQNAAF